MPVLVHAVMPSHLPLLPLPTPQVPVPRKELTDLIQEDVKGHRDIKKIPGLVITLAQVGVVLVVRVVQVAQVIAAAGAVAACVSVHTGTGDSSRGCRSRCPACVLPCVLEGNAWSVWPYRTAQSTRPACSVSSWQHGIIPQWHLHSPIQLLPPAPPLAAGQDAELFWSRDEGAGARD